MSEELREKRARRIGQKRRHIARQVSIARLHNSDTSEPHRFAKHNAMNCGIPNCPMCGNPRHSGYHKKASKLTLQELKHLQEKVDIELYDEHE